MNRSSALKGLSIACIEEVVDEAMDRLPSSFDITVPENRARVRDWMVRVCQVVTMNNADSITRAVSRAVEEASALAINPDYYEHKKGQQAKRKAMRAIQQVADRPKTKAQVEFDRMKDSPVKM